MPTYSTFIDVPPRTPEGAPASVLVQPIHKTIKSISLDFKAGALHLVGIRVLSENLQIVPWPSGWIFGQDEVKTFTLNYVMQGPPFRVVVQGYSVAADWPHKVNISMDIE